MRQSQHKWTLFYSPRNGRISIQACSECGIAKGVVKESHECTPASKLKKGARLKGWTSATKRSSSLEVNRSETIAI